MPNIKQMKIIVFITSLLPLAYLLIGLFMDWLGTNPIEVLTRDTGEWALRFLLITLAISSSRRLFGWSKPMRFRRMLGLFVWFYASVHLLTYLWLDQFFAWVDIFYDIIDRPFITVGMLAFLLLIPLAITSNNWSMKKLGKKWLQLHKLVYVIGILAILHFWWLVKADTLEPMIYALILTALYIERVVDALKKKRLRRAKSMQ